MTIYIVKKVSFYTNAYKDSKKGEIYRITLIGLKRIKKFEEEEDNKDDTRNVGNFL